jgi:uncharacterized protein YqhQ
MTDHPRATWTVAAQATMHCLTGCAIGEVLGMVVGTAAGLHNAATVALSIALSVALAADTVSIAIMELLDNTVVVAIPGAMDAGLRDGLFWAALALSLAVAFVITTPVNRVMIGRGKGHAVVHEYHHVTH